jgi:predicted transposase/invertase (TIGR01784 family)
MKIQLNDLINDPHDTLFKYVLEKKENAIYTIKENFDEDIIKNIYFDSLQIDMNEYTTDELRRFFSDVVYTCDYNFDGNKKKVKIAFLFEHKSRPYRNVALQVLEYMCCHWRKDINQKVKDYRTIITHVFYHGEQEWRAKTFYDFFRKIPKELIQFVPLFKFKFTTLHKYNYNKIKSSLTLNNELKIMYMTMLYVSLKKVLLDNLIKIINELTSNQDNLEMQNLIRAIKIYILSTVNPSKTNAKKVISCLKNLNYGGDMTSIATRLIKKGEIKGQKRGEKRGEKRGKKEKAKEDAINFYKEGVSIEIISKCTGLTIEEIKLVLNNETINKQ